MTSLSDLKDSILAGELKNFYVFCGQDFGLRQHYINKISESFDKIKSIDYVETMSGAVGGSGLFKQKNLYIVYNDLEFAKSKESVIKKFISKLKDDCVILTFDEDITNTNLFKTYNDTITYFPTVQDKIALEFIDSEVMLSLSSKMELAKNCCNDYGKICLEADKIKNYSESKNVSNQVAFEELTNAGQLIFEYPKYRPDDLMDDILQGNFKGLSYWDNVINNIYKEQFWITLTSIFNNYLIAYLIVKHGKYNGSSIAYNYGLPWGRIKTIRDYEIPFEADYLLNCAHDVSELDEKVKSGIISIDDLFNYFLTIII